MIRGKQCILKRLETSDLDALWPILSHPTVWPWLVWDPSVVTQQSLLPVLLASEAGTSSMGFAILTGEELVGAMTLNSIHPVHRSAQVGVLALAEGKRLGWLALDAMDTLRAYAFDTLNLNRLTCATWQDNETMAAIFKRMGIGLEARQKQAVWRNGEFQDRLVYALTRDQWRSTR